jgi:hypothetical protein
MSEVTRIGRAAPIQRSARSDSPSRRCPGHERARPRPRATALARPAIDRLPRCLMDRRVPRLANEWAELGRGRPVMNPRARARGSMSARPAGPRHSHARRAVMRARCPVAAGGPEGFRWPPRPWRCQVESASALAVGLHCPGAMVCRGDSHDRRRGRHRIPDHLAGASPAAAASPISGGSAHWRGVRASFPGSSAEAAPCRVDRWQRCPGWRLLPAAACGVHGRRRTSRGELRRRSARAFSCGLRPFRPGRARRRRSCIDCRMFVDERHDGVVVVARADSKHRRDHQPEAGGRMHNPEPLVDEDVAGRPVQHRKGATAACDRHSRLTLPTTGRQRKRRLPAS